MNIKAVVLIILTATLCISLIVVIVAAALFGVKMNETTRDAVIGLMIAIGGVVIWFVKDNDKGEDK